MKINMINNEYIQKLLNKLLDEYSMSEDFLLNLLKTDSIEKVKNYIIYQDELSKDINNWNKWVNIILQFEYMMETNEDARVRGILNLLTEVYNINTAFIAKLANIKEDELLIFINESNSRLNYDIKYKIASVAMNLSLTLRNSELNN